MISENKRTNKKFFILEQELSSFVDKWHKLLNEIGAIPEEFINKTGHVSNPHEVKAFDPNKYFTVFDKIKIKQGYVLDYVYDFDGCGGCVMLYARENFEPYFKSPEEYCKKHPCFRKIFKKNIPILGMEPTSAEFSSYLPYLEFDKSPMGYFQFALFALTAHRFYSYWHACYNDRKFLFGKKCLDSFYEEQKISPHSSLELLDLRPTVHFTRTKQEVVLFNYEVNRGFSFLHIYLKHPNICIGYQDKVVLKSETEVWY